MAFKSKDKFDNANEYDNIEKDSRRRKYPSKSEDRPNSLKPPTPEFAGALGALHDDHDTTDSIWKKSPTAGLKGIRPKH